MAKLTAKKVKAAIKEINGNKKLLKALGNKKIKVTKGMDLKALMEALCIAVDKIYKKDKKLVKLISDDNFEIYEDSIDELNRLEQDELYDEFQEED
jgi:hypothetical protein